MIGADDGSCWRRDWQIRSGSYTSKWRRYNVAARRALRRHVWCKVQLEWSPTLKLELDHSFLFINSNDLLEETFTSSPGIVFSVRLGHWPGVSPRLQVSPAWHSSSCKAYTTFLWAVSTSLCSKIIVCSVLASGYLSQLWPAHHVHNHWPYVGSYSWSVWSLCSSACSHGSRPDDSMHYSWESIELSSPKAADSKMVENIRRRAQGGARWPGFRQGTEAVFRGSCICIARHFSSWIWSTNVNSFPSFLSNRDDLPNGILGCGMSPGRHLPPSHYSQVFTYHLLQHFSITTHCGGWWFCPLWADWNPIALLNSHSIRSHHHHLAHAYAGSGPSNG